MGTGTCLSDVCKCAYAAVRCLFQTFMCVHTSLCVCVCVCLCVCMCVYINIHTGPRCSGHVGSVRFGDIRADVESVALCGGGQHSGGCGAHTLYGPLHTGKGDVTDTHTHTHTRTLTCTCKPHTLHAHARPPAPHTHARTHTHTHTQLLMASHAAHARMWLSRNVWLCVQSLLAIPLVGLYMGGASMVKLIEARREAKA